MSSQFAAVDELGLTSGSDNSSFSLQRRSMKGKAALVFGLVGSVAVLALIAVVYNGVGDDGKSTARALLGDGTNNGGTSGQVAQVGACNFSEIRSLLPSPIIYLLQTGGASDFIKSSDLGDYVDAIIGPAPSGLTEGGYKKRGSIAVSKIDASGFYYLNVEGEPGHAIKCILQGSDGYHRHWKGYGQIYTGPIHEGNYGQKDYLQIQDLVTGEVEYFRFRFT